jgi:hypothetical protein
MPWGGSKKFTNDLGLLYYKKRHQNREFTTAFAKAVGNFATQSLISLGFEKSC